MINTKELRQNSQKIAQQLARKGYQFPLETYQQLEQQRQGLQSEQQALQQKRNDSAKTIGIAKAKGEDTEPLKRAVSDLKTQLDTLTTQLDKVQHKLDGLLHNMPNIPDSSVPDGTDESQNTVVKVVGNIPDFSFTIQDHVALVENKGWLDNAAQRMSGSRFAVLRGPLARLHRALAQFMLDLQIEHGYEEINPPIIINDNSLFGTGQLPKFEADLFRIDKNDDSQRAFYLAPTAEVPLTNLFADRIFTVNQLPQKVVAHTACFRSEAGASGKDTRGLIRMHQFEKIELVQATHPEQSMQALEEMLSHAEAVLEALEIPYRVIELCAGDLGFSAAKTYDIEVWIPSQNTYREISSVSNCNDFQARRMQARFKTGNDKPQLLHTLNGSGLAVGRTLVAVLENYQQKNGDIAIPAALQQLMGHNSI